ncbi:helix-turn-helix transcriptional regulator [bacterium]|nr:helix-turn-helix transcriptional regulator [bacterium]
MVIRHFREERRLSQEDLAGACDVHRTYLSGLERGLRNPTIEVLSRIARALDVPLWKLLKGL